MPRFSKCWLDVQSQAQYKKYRRHGEAGAVDIEVVEEELQEIREAANAYENENPYCMDESALFWKMAPDGTLGTDQGAEGEHGKARITISLACNVTGSHKLEP